jgi:hypothetical protein
MDDETPITVDMIRPYLTDRGRIEIDFAIQTLRIRMLTQENIELRERVNNGQVPHVPMSKAVD